MVRFLLSCKAEVNMQDNRGLSPIMLATLKGHIETVDLLLKLDADVSLVSNSGYSALMAASCREYLLGYNEAVLQSLKEKKMPLLDSLPVFTVNACITLVNLLLDGGAQVNMQGKGGTSALHVASNIGNIETVRVLLEHGAQVDMQDDGGMSALHLAASKMGSQSGYS
jgi:serine/threonine-protein phosphatase 6 regulatory ankyrin repeat subunit B